MSNPQHLYTIAWRQLYNFRPEPFTKSINDAIEQQLSKNNFPEAKALIEKVKSRL